MTRVVLFGSQAIAVDFLGYLHGRADVELALVVASESELDPLFGYPSLSEHAREQGVPVVDSPRGSDAVERVADLRPDIVFSVYYRRILPERLLAVPRLGGVNIHPSALPAYRGPTPTAWAILNGETEFGITVHRMDEGIDTGDILIQERYPIGPDETGHELHVRAMGLGADLLRRHFDAIVNGDAQPHPQEGIGSYFGRLPRGHVIDWAAPAERIRNAIRVYASPYDRAETRLGNRRVLVDHAGRVRDESDYVLQGPGRIVDVLDDGVPIVACADGFLALDDCEIFPPLSDEERSLLLRPGRALG